jgi:regulator of sigma E protease
VNLAFMNLLPIPALDGGRIFFLIVNALVSLVIGKKISSEYEKYIHAGGMVLLLIFMAVVMFFDLRRLIKL